MGANLIGGVSVYITYGVTAHCQKPGCKLGFSFGPITTDDAEKWLEGFEPRPLTCPGCGGTAVYSRENLALVPLPERKQET